MKKIFHILFVLSFTLMISSALRADYPAPPANQIIGVNDGVFNDLEEADCRLCHENPDQYPVEDETLPNRHHLLYGTLIPDSTDVPVIDADGDGVDDTHYGCLNCHVQDTSSGEIEFIIERDCTQCHIQGSSFELTVHHRTDLALGNLPQGPDCKACHGSLVDNMEDGHFIPDYEPSLVTPKPSGGAGLPYNSEENGAGACNYCHSTGTGDPSTPGIDPPSGVLVYSNEDTHHETGFFEGMGAHGWVCFWCHDNTPPFETQIRVCENCHGPDSLHNIQVDSDDDGIINPGVELPGYGHIGDPDECWGCHGFAMSSAPIQFGYIIPYITGITKSVITAGSDTVVTLTGSAFTNIADSTEVASTIRLSPDAGDPIELIPDAISESSLTVTIPGSLAIGNYALRALKIDKLSNPVVLSITPDVVITATICDSWAGTLTITGSGLREKPEGTDDYINCEMDGLSADVTSWTDNEITAFVSSCGDATVNALFGSATYENVDICCVGDFEGDRDVDGTDGFEFRQDFGTRNCNEENPCNGDFDCDQDIDGTDAFRFKVDFGRLNCTSCACLY